MQKTYDLIVSLGGSCLAAKQVELRGLRLCSLPLDWLAYNGTEQIPTLAELFKTDFEHFLAPNELVELPKEEKGDSTKFQVKSTRTGFAFIHDFKSNILDTNNNDRKAQFEAVKDKYVRRIKRMLDLFAHADAVLLLLDCVHEPPLQHMQGLMTVLKYKFPSTKFDLAVCVYGQPGRPITAENIVVNKVERARTKRDYLYRSYEWDFLDDIHLSTKFRNRNRFRFRFRILPGAKTSLFRFQLSIAKFHFDISFGKALG